MRNTISDLIIARSDRVTFHPLLIAPRDPISPALANNLEFVCLDAKPHRCLVVCKQCHTVFYNMTWNRPIIMKHIVRFHGIAQTDEKLKCRVRKTVQATREALNQPAIMPNLSTLTPPTSMEAHTSTPPTPIEAAPCPSAVVKISHRRKPSQEVRVPHETEASAPHTPSTLGTDALTLADKKQPVKKRSHRRKAGAIDVPPKQIKQQKAARFEDKTNF